MPGPSVCSHCERQDNERAWRGGKGRMSSRIFETGEIGTARWSEVRAGENRYKGVKDNR